jgi:putative lipoic acid-binding regulatory protein
MRSVTDQPKGLQFPCDYRIKAMGLAEPGFDALVVEIVRRHSPDFPEGAVSLQASRNGRYVSVTVLIKARSLEQLDAIYADLTAHEKVLARL